MRMKINSMHQAIQSDIYLITQQRCTANIHTHTEVEQQTNY